VIIRILSPGDDGTGGDGVTLGGLGTGDLDTGDLEDLFDSFDWQWTWNWTWDMGGDCDSAPMTTADVDWQWNWTWNWGSDCASQVPAVTGDAALPGAPLEPPGGVAPAGAETTPPALSRVDTDAVERPAGNHRRSSGGATGRGDADRGGPRSPGSGGAVGANLSAGLNGAFLSQNQSGTTRSATKSAPRAASRPAASPDEPAPPKLFVQETGLPVASPASGGVAAIALIAALAALCLAGSQFARSGLGRVEQLFQTLLGSRLERPG
jgi:hypothetical protein